MSENKRAVITGASGQDALLLSEYLIEEHGYEVWAVARRVARPQSRHVNSLLERYPDNYHLINGDITDMTSILRVLELSNPQEFYNLAAQSHVGISFKEPLSTYDITQMGAINCIEAVRSYNPFIRVYQASSSEMFGGTRATESKDFTIGDDVGHLSLATIDESTPLHPMSPYGVAKTAAHSHARLCRDAYGMHISCGILFNHESELRKPNFVTRKVTAYVAKLVVDGGDEKLKLGCLDFARDWGCAKDYVRGMHLMLQQDEPGDYVLSTGQVYTGPDLLDAAFAAVGMRDWHDYVVLDPAFERPSDVKVLVGDASLAKEKLGWEPRRHFHQLITEMVMNDIDVYKERGAIDE
ncbi:MAG: GDP-mannose 4,6-dehydratase [Planctomycetota bacterium]|jgi:GDPmannose 4,6-dehydratase